MAADALNQIKDRKDSDELALHTDKNIFGIGIAFVKKEVCLKYEKLK